MKITLFLLLFVTFQAYCENGYSQSAKISIPRSTLKVSELLTQIESQTDYLFVYNKKSVDTKRVVNVDATNQPVSEILDKAFEGTGIHYVVEGNNIVLTKNITEHASTQQQKQITVKGVVTDMRGEPIIGANVVEKGTTNGGITDINGKIRMNVKAGALLQISFVGYTTQEIKATPNLRVVLKDDTELLDEVVVVGYGSQKKENLTGAVASVNVNQTLEGRPIADIGRGLQGTTPGLSIQVPSHFRADERSIQPVVRLLCPVTAPD